MKYLYIILFLCMNGCYTYAQQQPAEPMPTELLRELDLSPQQQQAMKDSITAYRLAERKRALELRRKLYGMLNQQQRMMLRRWWRNHPR